MGTKVFKRRGDGRRTKKVLLQCPQETRAPAGCGSGLAGPGWTGPRLIIRLLQTHTHRAKIRHQWRKKNPTCHTEAVLTSKQFWTSALYSTHTQVSHSHIHTVCLTYKHFNSLSHLHMVCHGVCRASTSRAWGTQSAGRWLCRWAGSCRDSVRTSSRPARSWWAAHRKKTLHFTWASESQHHAGWAMRFDGSISVHLLNT